MTAMTASDGRPVPGTLVETWQTRLTAMLDDAATVSEGALSAQAVDPGEAGAIEIHGQVFDGNGDLVAYPDALVELWAGGQFARARTDAGGTYRAVMRKPVPAPLPGGQAQAPSVNIALFARGLLKQVQTRLYFPDEEQANATDPALGMVPAQRRPTLIAHPGDGGLRFDIRLQGEGETVFFAF